MRRSLLCIAILHLVVFNAHSVPAQEVYELQIDRPMAVGQRYQVSASGSSSETSIQRIEKEVVEQIEASVSARFVGVMEILEIDEQGQPSRVALQIAEYNGRFNGRPVEIDTTRRVVLDDEDGQTTAQYEDGAPLSEDQVSVLDAALSRFVDADASDKTDDEVFGFDQPRRVGETWEANHAAIAEEFASGGEIAMDAEDIKSTCQLIDIKDKFGEPVASISMNCGLANVGLPGLEEHGGVVRGSGFSFSIQALVPIDPESPNSQFAMALSMSIQASIPLPEGKGQIDLEVNAEYQMQAEIRLVEE